MHLKFNLFYLVLIFARECFGDLESNDDDQPLVFTIASEETEGYLRYLRSAKHYKIDVQTLGLGKPWLGGDMEGVGGGYKINLLREALEPYKDNDQKIVMFTDSYDVVFAAPMSTITEKFRKSEASVLFGAENYCWPDKTLKTKYPTLNGLGARFLNSGLFMGYASKVYEILKSPIENTDDDQLFYTRAYLDEEKRKKLNIKLDHTSIIFQNLNGAESQVLLSFTDNSGEAFVHNQEFKTNPLIIHGNGPSKLTLNSFANYLAGAFLNGESQTISENILELDENNLPLVTIGLFVESPTPFLEEFFSKIEKLDYPKDKIDVIVHNNVPYHEKVVKSFMKANVKSYRSVKVVDKDDGYDEKTARELAVSQCIKNKCNYLLIVDSIAHLDSTESLRNLMAVNKQIVAPIISRPYKVWSNFWGAISDQGFYARSNDYMDIVSNKIKGIFNVPFISGAYLIKASVLPEIIYKLPDVDADMAFCYVMRKKNIFMHVTNAKFYGHMIDNEYYDSTKARPDFYQLFNNRYDWEEKYIHPDYSTQLQEGYVQSQPCPDVFWFKIATDQFADDLVAIMEDFGRWSDGSSSDTRLQGGYEAVPTRDIHMNQVGLESLWLKFLKDYVRPLQEKIFLGYFHDPPKSLMNFVVRYRPDEQPSLRPHHDSSTYTINIALNSAGTDYEGGGCHFLRYNCSVLETKKGWMIMHPGRLTHFHEGLLVTNGTRYIMISFVDP